MCALAGAKEVVKEDGNDSELGNNPGKLVDTALGGTIVGGMRTFEAGGIWTGKCPVEKLD